ncbi:hypothetical protein N7468_006501 [Penicillium chermesinum]|uniref:mRNA-capping enzyme subunit beta n=1 Tax=Penicillium chermesinum TaxID=63820 RepID=A0A9W9TJP4_9EURO|nr:uncharacterized protein N7468_006501 [Penicillium chermesinum]KAJ5225276.1 hypothetical protein N7468_006501 [Penicillium chermesinum]
MDLRNIMNNDAGGASNAPPATGSSSPPSDPAHQQRVPTSYSDYPARPPQPQPPVPHAQHASPDRSSPYGPPQSPYAPFNNARPPPLNTTVQAQRSQSPTHVSTPYGAGARDSYGATVYNSQPQHPSVPTASPYTPQQPVSAGPQSSESQSYFAQQRSHSLHTVMTNPPRPIPQETSPSTAPPLPSQYSSTHRSVSSTPLGPPPAFSRHSPLSTRPPSSGRDSPRNPLSSPRPTPDQIQSPVAPRNFSPGARPSESNPQFYPTVVKQEPSETVSPRFASRQNSAAATSDSAGPPSRSDDNKWNDSPTAQSTARPSPDPVNSQSTSSQIRSSPSGPRAHKIAKMDADHEPSPRVSSQPPKPKRRRYREPPIFAQRVVRNKGKCPVIPFPQPPITKQERRDNADPWGTRRGSLLARVSETTSKAPITPSQTAPTPSILPTNSNGPPSQPPSAVSQTGSLGAWEPSITGFIPHEEITKMLCDFLFQHVVVREDVAVGPAGSAAAGQGAIIEVEAKLGHVMDMDRRERLSLPVLTETVLNRENSQFRTSFESNMSVEQHRAMNNFLNDAVKASMPNTNPKRVPVSYAHKKERDTFYEVSPADLPPIIRQNLNPRHKPKVRVTTDQRTGEVLAKIIKCRVADIDVLSPCTAVDWRVSVNLEMEYPGDISNLPVVDASRGGRGERNKDRMSYRHLAYQVDLTQHELEVEVSAAELRRQGNLARKGDPTHQYEELVKGFVDNIRVLARAVPR